MSQSKTTTTNNQSSDPIEYSSTGSFIANNYYYLQYGGYFIKAKYTGKAIKAQLGGKSTALYIFTRECIDYDAKMTTGEEKMITKTYSVSFNNYDEMHKKYDVHEATRETTLD